jgi:hypothetical protein
MQPIDNDYIYDSPTHIYPGDQYFLIFCCGTAPALNYCKSSNKKNAYFSNECELNAVKKMLTVHYIK